MSKNTINIYAAGGAGCNAASGFQLFAGHKEEFAACINPIYIDTSRSNLRADIPNDHVFLIPDMDGSGKKRDRNYEAIAGIAPEILHTHKPAFMNIVIHSASGGSGSVIGPTLVSLLLERGENVIVLMVGSRSSMVEVENTLKTLQTYEQVSQKRGKPVAMFYRENDKGRGAADTALASAIPLLATICSGTNRELDSEDIKNFINFMNFPKLAMFGPGVVSLEFFSGKIELARDQHLITAITLTDDNTNSDIEGQLCPYQATGFIPEAAKTAFSVKLPLHTCLISGVFFDTVKSLKATLEEHSATHNVVRHRSISSDATSDHLGMVL